MDAIRERVVPAQNRTRDEKVRKETTKSKLFHSCFALSRCGAMALGHLTFSVPSFRLSFFPSASFLFSRRFAPLAAR